MSEKYLLDIIILQNCWSSWSGKYIKLIENYLLLPHKIYSQVKARLMIVCLLDCLLET